MDYNTFSLAIKKQINENLSFAIKMDEPYGADIRYTDGTLGSLGLGIIARAGVPAGTTLHTALASEPNARAW